MRLRRNAWRRWLPGLSGIREYRLAWLRHDIVAGLALSAVLLPVGIAYAVASGVPPTCGLYATIFGLLAYALFGPSRMLVLGPDSSLVALILGIVLPLSAGDSQRAIALAGMLAIVSGSLCVLAGTARLGFITELLSKPIRYGYMGTPEKGFLPGTVNLPPRPGITDPINFSMRSAAHQANQWTKSV